MTSEQLLTAPDAAFPALRGAVAGLPSYVPGRKSAGLDIAALASNESHYQPLPAAAAAVTEAAGTMNRYPDSAAVELRERLARHLGVTAGEVAVGPGSVGVLQQIVAGLCDAGDEVIFAWRSFEAYPILVELAGARAVRIPLDDAEGHDLEAMAAAVTDRTKVILLCTPNNPTGVPISHERIEDFLQSVRSDILVVVDEAYVEYADAGSGPDSLALYRQYPNVCILRTEALGAAALLATIFPALPVWLMAFVFIVVLTAVNLTSVKNFGEFEFWFALLKVAAIIGFLLVGFALLFGWLPGVQSPGLSNFMGDGFAPSGFAGIATALFVVAFAFGGTEIVSVAAAETAEPARSVKKAVRTVLWRILVFYIGAIFIIAAVVPVGSDGLKSPFAAVLETAGMPGAATAITLVAVAALLSALNANLYGASRMAYSLAERGEAPRLLASVSKARVPVPAVLASVAFGVVTVVLELAFPEMVLPILLNIVGSTCLLVWTSALLAQLALRLRADREGTELPLRMPGFPGLTVFGLVILAAIFTVGFIGEDSRPQLLSTFALVALLAVGCWLNQRNRKVAPVGESSGRAKEPVLID